VTTLFELRTEQDIRREAVCANEAAVHAVLMGSGPWELSERQRRLLELLRGRQGRLQAVSISELAARLSVDPRSIKADVRELVVSFRLPIVASRDAEDGGYFFAVTAEESLSGTADYVKEIVALAERVRIIRKMPSVRALLGQMALELPELEETL
jgi:predicted DNA-binding transcriptional regulator YafY